ncbi:MULTISPECIES: helix-turn-helix transcriptional regulator [Kaistia]|uniref:Helix-turn-helix domain-containing protein n=1 Tax=Kaistia nematophila TaxID=2994654 RepID=A0A9X3DY73_9HYPH|nr:hypothetical protein [Kaistia nematophila]MCX5568166.1 hypothetical protein [Kaistia nematophila]
MTKQRSKRDDTSPIADLFGLPVLNNPPEVSSGSAPAASAPATAKSGKGARKPFKIFHPRKAKQDRTYNRADVMDLYGVGRNTVTNWMKEGLVTVPGHPVLFRGEDLNTFHEARRAGARRNCSPGEFLCFHCKKVSSLKGAAAEVHWHSDHTCTLRWFCPRPTCSKPNETFQSRSQVRILEEQGVNLTSVEDDYSPSRRPGEVVQITPKSEVIHEPVE